MIETCFIERIGSRSRFFGKSTEFRTHVKEGILEFELSGIVPADVEIPKTRLYELLLNDAICFGNGNDTFFEPALIDGKPFICSSEFDTIFKLNDEYLFLNREGVLYGLKYRFAAFFEDYCVHNGYIARIPDNLGEPELLTQDENITLTKRLQSMNVETIPVNDVMSGTYVLDVENYHYPFQ
ncbi:hypothetical protein HNP86_002028 [Methanococcus maripaludis]|uniref:Uncharacterized protein n=1 Tax=Methanococcus maripaludis TaxID=39152 RepID=A0A7J9NW06_METMI|nr:hypothetical protein [Methanococcus maripaludis]MBA2851869.1 hypothetical protein [Methanococcus maripaludis]